MQAFTDIKKRILEANADYHDFWADTHDTNVPYISRKITRKYYWNLIQTNILLSGNVLQNADVLEIGCGTGTFTDIFIAKGAASFTGIDLSPKMIEKAKEKANIHKYQVPVNFYVSALEDFAMENAGKFDIIQSSSFIHHLSNIDEGINCIKKMLKPNGIYIAIHEEVNDFKKTKMDKLDDQLQYLFGYGGSKVISKSQRIKDTIKFFFRPILFRYRRLISSNKRQPEIAITKVREKKAEDTTNYVDFQLNNSFSLSSTCSKYGTVKPYCYLGFPELMIFGKPMNFEMLIMKKAETK